MPFSFLNEDTVFLIATTILKNFYLHLLDVIGGRVKGLGTARLKRFLRMFVVVPAKWVKSGRRNVLNLYTKRRIYLELEKHIVWGVLNETESLIMRHQWSSQCENEASEAINRTDRTK